MDPLGVCGADDRLRSRADGQALLERLVADVGDPGDLGGETRDVLGFLHQVAFGDEQGEIGVEVAGGLDPAVQAVAHVFPEGVAVGLDDHAALDVGIVGQVGLAHDVDVPLRKILGARGQRLLKGLPFLLGHDRGLLMIDLDRPPTL
jgi:hypothetical protein